MRRNEVEAGRQQGGLDDWGYRMMIGLLEEVHMSSFYTLRAKGRSRLPVLLFLVSSSHVLDAGAGHLHTDVGVLQLPRLVLGGEGGYWADGGHLGGRLVGDAAVPLRGLGLSMRLWVRRRGGLGLRGGLLRRRGRRGLAHDLALGVPLVGGHLLWLLLDGAGGVQSVRGRLGGGRVGVEALLRGRRPRGGRVAAGAVLDAIGRGRVGDLKRESLAALARHLLVLVLHRRGRGVRVRVHGGDAGVALLGDEVAVLRQARGPLEQLDAGVLLLRRLLVARVGGVVLGRHGVVVVGTARQAVAVGGVWLRHAVSARHVLAILGKGLRALDKVAVVVHHVRRPWHTVVALWCRRGIVIARLGRRVIVL